MKVRFLPAPLVAVGTPLMTPVLTLRDKPSGKAPAVIWKVRGLVPPAALTVSAYSPPTAAAGKDAGLTVMAGQATPTTCDRVTEQPFASIARKVKLLLPTEDGVPVMAPLLALRDSPAGKLPEATLNV